MSIQSYNFASNLLSQQQQFHQLQLSLQQCPSSSVYLLMQLGKTLEWLWLRVFSSAQCVLNVSPLWQVIFFNVTSILITSHDNVFLLLTFLHCITDLFGTCWWASHSRFRHSGCQRTKLSAGSHCGGALIEATVIGILPTASQSLEHDEQHEVPDASHMSLIGHCICLNSISLWSPNWWTLCWIASDVFLWLVSFIFPTVLGPFFLRHCVLF